MSKMRSWLMDAFGELLVVVVLVYVCVNMNQKPEINL